MQIVVLSSNSFVYMCSQRSQTFVQTKFLGLTPYLLFRNFYSFTLFCEVLYIMINHHSKISGESLVTIRIVFAVIIPGTESVPIIQFFLRELELDIRLGRKAKLQAFDNSLHFSRIPPFHTRGPYTYCRTI